MPESRPATRFIFVTGGVVSALGKGIAAASLGQLLVARGLSVTIQKFDPYINVDPGTMSPFQHGEVFVTEDGAETDLDLGHYERFTDVNTSRALERHRRRDLQLGHPARAPRRLPGRDGPGDPAHHRRDQEPHQAGRRVDGRRHRDHRDRRHGGRHRVAAVPRGAAPVRLGPRARPLHVRAPHARPVPRARGRAEDQADAALGPGAAPHRYPAGHGHVPLRGGARHRDPREDRAVREPAGRARSSPRATSTRSTRCRSSSRPRASTTEILSHFGLEAPPPDLSAWKGLVDRIEAARQPVRIALVGKYNQLADAYLSVIEALNHAGSHHGGRVEVHWVDSERLTDGEVERELATCDGILVPGGFGVRGIEGKIQAARYAREHGVPYLGICLGMQIAVAEFARHVAGMEGANSTEFDPETPYPVIDLLPGAEGGPRHGRHDAPRRRSREAARRHAGPRDLRRRRHLRAPPPPLRGQQPPPQAARAGRPASSAARRRTTGSSRSSSCPSTRSSSRRSTTPSSSRGRCARSRCSASSSGRRSSWRASARPRSSPRCAPSRTPRPPQPRYSGSPAAAKASRGRGSLEPRDAVCTVQTCATGALTVPSSGARSDRVSSTTTPAASMKRSGSSAGPPRSRPCACAAA